MIGGMQGHNQGDAAYHRERLGHKTDNTNDGILCHDCLDTGWLENSVEGRYVCSCIAETEPYQQLTKQRDGLQERVADWRKVAEENLQGMAVCKQHVAELTKQRDELLAAVKEVIDDAEECLDSDDWMAMLVSLAAFHNLSTAYEAIASVKEGS